MSSTGNTVGLSANQKKWIYIAISFAAMMIIKNVTFPSSITTINGAELTATGQEALSVLVLALLLWITEAIPFHFTGILAMVLLSVFGVDSFANIVKIGFGNINVIFFIGVFILSAFPEFLVDYFGIKLWKTSVKHTKNQLDKRICK